MKLFHSKDNSLLYKSIFFLAVTLMLILALWIVNTYVFTKSTGYQAIFLTNGDVYFGNLERKIGGQFMRLTNVYYLQIDDASQLTEGQSGQNPQFTLVKLGKEIHGPKDEMFINRDHVIFVENLTESSQVVQTIKSRQ